MEEKDIKETFLRLKSGYPQRSFLYYGPDKHKSSEILREIKNIAILFTNYIIWIKSTPSENLSDVLLRELCEVCPYIVPLTGAGDLTELLINTGQQAKSSGQCICIFIEDLHSVKKEDLQKLCTAISRTNQLNLPIIAFMTGLPSIIRKLGRARFYAERLFDYTEIV